ncbi:MAG: hypothetical protein ACOYJK_09025 [Prevotella sp.]|jgi:hypothetical protein
MITQDSIEQAYAFLHQKEHIYSQSDNPRQQDEIEYAISSYVQSMNPDLYAMLARGRADFLLAHATFGKEMSEAVARLETML